jgi:hypothetical protein
MTSTENLVGKLEIKTLLGRPKNTWEDYIKVDLRKVVWYGVDFIIFFQMGSSGGM